MAKLTVAESLALIHKEREALDKKEKALLSQHKSTALAQILKIAKENALTLTDIASALKENKTSKVKTKSIEKKRVFKPRGKVPAKYKNPSNPSETWTGRGKMPAWVKALKDNQLLETAVITK